MALASDEMSVHMSLSFILVWFPAASRFPPIIYLPGPHHLCIVVFFIRRASGDHTRANHSASRASAHDFTRSSRLVAFIDDSLATDFGAQVSLHGTSRSSCSPVLRQEFTSALGVCPRIEVC